MLKYRYIFLKNILKNSMKGAGFGQFRYFKEWRTALKPGSSSVKDERPWLTFEVIDFFKEHLSKTTKVFEYGGGGSTLFWVNRASEVVTVEHDKEWFKVLSEMIQSKKCDNWKGNFIEPGIGTYVEDPDRSDPKHYHTDDEKFLQNNFYSYASAIDKYPEAYFDVVLIDGRSRASCMMHGMTKLKSGGYLILDNSDREYYLEHFRDQLKREFTVIIDNYGPCPYLLEFSKTTVWKKN